MVTKSVRNEINQTRHSDANLLVLHICGRGLPTWLITSVHSCHACKTNHPHNQQRKNLGFLAFRTVHTHIKNVKVKINKLCGGGLFISCDQGSRDTTTATWTKKWLLSSPKKTSVLVYSLVGADLTTTTVSTKNKKIMPKNKLGHCSMCSHI